MRKAIRWTVRYFVVALPLAMLVGKYLKSIQGTYINSYGDVETKLPR